MQLGKVGESADHMAAEVGKFEEHSLGGNSEPAMVQLEGHDALGAGVAEQDCDGEDHDHAEEGHDVEGHAVVDRVVGDHAVDVVRVAAIADHRKDLVELVVQELEDLYMELLVVGH